MDSLFKGVAINLQKRQQVFIEADRLVVVTVEQPLAMQFRLVDQTRQMHITAELLVRTARMQPFHRNETKWPVTGERPRRAPPTSTCSQQPAFVRATTLLG